MSKSGKKQPTGNYEVGYCRPPLHSQWQRGQSGNPRGAVPVEFLEFYDEIIRASKRRASLPLEGKMVRMTMMEIIAQKLMIDAARGVASARRDVMKLMASAQQLQASSEDIEVVAELVFDEEENRLVTLACENEQLKEEIERLRALERDSTPPTYPTALN
jgi:hypothetical protein